MNFSVVMGWCAIQQVKNVMAALIVKMLVMKQSVVSMKKNERIYKMKALIQYCIQRNILPSFILPPFTLIFSWQILSRRIEDDVKLFANIQKGENYTEQKNTLYTLKCLDEQINGRVLFLIYFSVSILSPFSNPHHREFRRLIKLATVQITI